MNTVITELWGIEVHTVRGWQTHERLFYARAQAESWLRMHGHEYRTPPRLVRYAREEADQA